jgi:hypothetical protein
MMQALKTMNIVALYRSGKTEGEIFCLTGFPAMSVRKMIDALPAKYHAEHEIAKNCPKVRNKRRRWENAHFVLDRFDMAVVICRSAAPFYGGEY